MNTKQLLENLLKLQALEFDAVEADGATEEAIEKKIAKLRLQIPEPFLGHYDRLGARGKKGVAAVRRQICTGCHVQVTRAMVINLMHGEDIQVCENCGRYLYLSETDELQLPAAAPAKKSAAKMQKRAELAYAA